jgi:hypothetical protein
MKTWYQTDFDGIVRAEGCLAFSLIDACYEGLMNLGKSPRDLEGGEIEELLHHAHKQGHLQRGPEDRRFGVYVMDHGAFANEVLCWLLEPYVHCTYVAAEYMPGEGRASWGDPLTGTGVVILQVKTPRGGGHFRRLCYDPWLPSPGIARVRSVRYYRFRLRDKPRREV